MKQSIFRITPLPSDVAETARQHAKSGAPDHRSVVADAPGTYPCRHCLRWAEPGERVILFPYQAIPSGHPYSETGPVFVHEHACTPYAETAKYPDAFRTGRVFRAYNRQFDMIDAQPINGSTPEAIIEKLFDNPDTVFVDARSADRGCFTFRIAREQ